MNTETTVYIFDENGIIEDQQLESFCKKFSMRTSFPFKKFNKEDIDSTSTICKKFSSENLEYTIFDYGYVMKIEGDIRQSILLLKELDAVIDSDIIYFVSPSQRVVNSGDCKYPRGASEKEITQFLDVQFCNNEYTNALIYKDET
jgi:hypothetical protein